MPHDNSRELAMYRLGRAEEMLAAASREMSAGDCKSSNNRAYYAVFHAMRALLALEGVDYKKHSGVIAHFNQYYIRTGIFPVTFSDIIREASLIRNSSDYDDFYVCSLEETTGLISSAGKFVEAVKQYLMDTSEKTSDE